MAKARSTPAPVVLEPDEEEELPEGGELVNAPGVAEVERLLASLPQGAEIRVKFYRKANDRTNLVRYAGTEVLTPDFDPEEACARRGAGTWRVQFNYPRGVTDERGQTTRTITIEIDPAAAAAVAPPELAPAVPGTPGDWALREKLARLEGQLEGMRGRGDGPAPVDPLTMLEKLSTLFRNTAPVAPVPVDPLGSIEKIIGAVEKVVNVGRDLAPEREPANTDWGHVVDRTMSAVEKLVTEQQAGRLGRGAAAPELVVPGLEALPMWQQEVASWVPKLLERAKADKDPALAADVFLEDISGGTRAALAGIVGQEGFVTATVGQLGTLFPESKDFAPWFTAFLEAVRESLKPDPAELAEGNGKT